MIKVTVWWDNLQGSSISCYLVNIPTDGQRGSNYFKAAPVLTAIRRILTEFEKDLPDARINQIRVEDTPDKVLQP